MRKISLLLALLMVAACCMLASCGEEETSSAPEVSSQAPATSSEAPATSSEAEPESSEEAPESSEEESKEPEYVKNPDAIPTEGANVAAGKEYTISEQFRANPETYGYDESCPVSYPDDNFELTDGVIPTNDDRYSAACWMALNQGTPAQTERGYGYVQFDLGQSYEISEVTIVSLRDGASGINAPHTVEVLVSEDGENWYSASVLTTAVDELEDNVTHTLVSEMDVTGRYVEIRVISYGWCFMGEIEIK
ncbi:MAG: discoidin domain-containing protein [Clostridia bacterium]|nr:discoidin domain-containing protein [Clostridia bacterium]